MKTLREIKGPEKNTPILLNLHDVLERKEKKAAVVGGNAVAFLVGTNCPGTKGKGGNSRQGRGRFTKRFEQKYGIGAVAKFRAIIENPEKSLSDVGRHFGFTREYARQVYMKMYGCTYAKAYQRKCWQRKKRMWETREKGSRRWQAALAIQEKLEAMGLDTAIVKKRDGIQILADAYRLTLRLSSSYFMVGQKKYSRFSLSQGQFARRCDFFVCVFRTGKDVTHYMLPRRFMPKSGFSVAVGATEKESKYALFKEAWDLVKGRPHSIAAKRLKDPGQINACSRLSHPNPISQDIRKTIDNRLADKPDTPIAFDGVDRAYRTHEGMAVRP